MAGGHEVAMALRAAYLAMHRRADESLAPFGVTADQFVLLAALDEAEALSQQDLVRRVSSDASTVRAMLLLLEGRGLVARRPHPADGRARSVALTREGRRAFRRMKQGSEPFRVRLLAAAGPRRAAGLVDQLLGIAAAMAAGERAGIKGGV